MAKSFRLVPLSVQILVLIVLLDSSGLMVCSAVNPGLQFRLSQQGIDYAGNVVLDIFSNDLKQIKIPNVSGQETILFGPASYTFSNINIVRFVKPASALRMIRGVGFTWSLTNADISCRANWRYNHWLASDSGSVDASVSGVSISVSVSLRQDPYSGRPTISSTGCSCTINNFRVTVNGGASWFYNLVLGLFNGAIKNMFQGILCKEAEKVVNENARQELATLPMEIPIDNRWIFDYRLVAPPAFQAGYMDSFHKGEFFFKGDASEAPFQPMPLVVSKTDSSMLTIWASDYTLNTVGYVLYKHSALRFSLTKNDLPGNDKRFLDTTCATFTCFGLFVPQVGTLFPGASIEIEMSASSPPTATITTQGLTASAAGYITCSARLINGTLAYLFKVHTSVKMSVLPALVVSMQNVTLKGQVTSFSPTFTLVDSKIGPIDDLFSPSVVNLASRVFIIPELNAYLQQKGVPIPSIKDVHFRNTKLQMQTGSLRISSDVFYVRA